MSNEYIKGDKVKNINGELVSGYILNAQTVFEELNQVSPSFCLAKWFNVSLHIPTGQTHSCYHPRSHKIPMEEVAIDVSALHNTKSQMVALGVLQLSNYNSFIKGATYFHVRCYF